MYLDNGVDDDAHYYLFWERKRYTDVDGVIVGRRNGHGGAQQGANCKVHSPGPSTKALIEHYAPADGIMEDADEDRDTLVQAALRTTSKS